MTLKLQLTPDLERRLREAAERQGLSEGEWTLRLLDQHLSAGDRSADLDRVLQSWIDDEPEEQRETGEYLVRTLDEDRPSDRKLFPAELKGKTW